MHTNHKLKLITVSMIAATITMIGHNVFAHTTIETPSIPEGTRVSNNVVIGHGCGERNVIGTSVVFPDGVDSTITVDGQPHAGENGLADFVSDWGSNNQKVYSKAVFTFQGEKVVDDNVTGFWAGGGDSLPHDMSGFIPFRAGPVTITTESCAASVKFHVSIVDICEITPVSGFNDETINRWTLTGLGTPYDRIGENGAASLTITRTSALPASCGTKGVAVEVKPSAAQINRDMPIKIDGNQVWPQ